MKIYTLVSAVLLSISLLAQAPTKMSYQSVIRGANNTLVIEKTVGVRISILQGNESGSSVYSELHTPTTNSNGLASLSIGGGKNTTGDFAKIDWSKGPYFVKTETDVAGGTNYQLTAVSELMSVPYALYAANSQPGPKGDVGLHGPAGKDGINGAVGKDGLQGPKGEQGLPGKDGIQGSIGLTGLKGEQGLPGKDGIQGSIGLTGPKGEQGLPGKDGIQGSIGLTGPKGEQGLPGKDGVQGSIGLTGPKGEQGLPGKDGIQGSIGLTGPKGDQGLPGKDGIQGPIGLTGPKGEQGFPGQDGVQGPIGLTGPKGDAADLIVSVSEGDTLKFNNGSFVIIPGITNANPKQISYGVLYDGDGNSYKTVKIGKYEWMAENLKVTHYNDGTPIDNITDGNQWHNLTSGAWCYYNNDISFNTNFGKLYNWYVLDTTTNGNKNVCPTGWHVSREEEWQITIDYLGRVYIAGGKMKEVGTTNWSSPNSDATNSSGFTARAGGSTDFSGSGMYDNAWFWSIYRPNWGTYEPYLAVSHRMNWGFATVENVKIMKYIGASIRCVKN